MHATLDIKATDGAGVSARLLLALTSFYVQRTMHTADERQQYLELATRLADHVDEATRTAVADRLRCHPDAPAALIERIDGAAPAGGGDDAGAEATPAPHARNDAPDLAPAPEAPAPLTPEAAEAFFAGSPAERRQMLSMAPARPEAAPPPARRFHMRVDTAVWHATARGQETGGFGRELERLIDAPAALCARILNDPTGEPMVVVARATGMPVALLQRVLLLLSPEVSHPVARVHELTDLYHGLDSRTARDLVAAWREGGARTKAAAAPAPPANLRTRLHALTARLAKPAPDQAVPRQAGARAHP